MDQSEEKWTQQEAIQIINAQPEGEHLDQPRIKLTSKFDVAEYKRWSEKLTSSRLSNQLG
jgi:hypothetical protein